MAILEKGRVCIKKTGRNAGEKVTVAGKKDGMILVENQKGKKKKANPRDLFPTGETK